MPDTEEPGLPDETTSRHRSSSPAPSVLSRMDVLLGLRLSVWEGALSTVWAVLTGGAFLTGFALYLHADNFAIGLLTAIPTSAGLVQLVSSYSGERRDTRKPLVGVSALVGRMLWLPILVLPFALHRGAIYPFLGLFAASYILLNVSVPAWTSWMSDLVPADYRGRYFARRNMIAGFVGMVVSLPAAWFLDFTTKRHHWEKFGFGSLFFTAVIAAMVAFVLILRQPEPPKTVSETTETQTGIKAVSAYFQAPFTDPNFLRLMTFNTLFAAGQFFAAPFFVVYAIQVLKLNYVSLQILAAVTSISSLASMPLWGYLADKFGNKPLLAIGVWGVFTLPITWMCTSPNHPLTTILLLVELNLAGGLFWAGVGLTQFNLLIGFSPPGKTSIYVGTMASVTGIAGGLAPLLGGVTMVALHGWHVHALGLDMRNYHITFLIAALLRVAALPFLRSVVDAQSTETSDVLRQLGKANPSSWRHIRRLQHGDQDARLKATEALGGSKTQLAGDELRAALMDPSRAVREEAARALGEIGDSASVDALMAALRDPASGLTEVAASALARIGDRKANGPLAGMLRSGPEGITRRGRIVVAQALGSLGGADAVTALLQALGTSDDEELTEALVSALGISGSSRATPALMERLDRPNISYGMRQLLIRSLGEIGDLQAVDSLRRTLAAYPGDEGLAPALADALARLDDGESALTLLDTLRLLKSPIARKQVAHAIGRLLGQGDLAYSLLSQREMDREASIKKLLQEFHRAVSGSAADRPLRVAQKALAEGDMRCCVRGLNRAVRALVPQDSSEAVSPIYALCREYLDLIATEKPGDLTVETMVTAYCALNGLKPIT